MPRQVLIIDHDDASRIAAERYLTSTARWRVRALADASEALAILGTRVFDAILVNLSPEGATPESGVRVMKAARAARPNAHIVVVGDHDPMAIEIDDVHLLATTYLSRPQPMDAVERALRSRAGR